MINLNDITTDQGDTFNDFSSLGQYSYLNRAAIYIIWTNLNQPNRYQILYIGQSGQTGTRLDATHHKYQCWVNHSNGNLYVAFWWMPSNQFSEQQRKTSEQNLIQKYNPICNG